MQCSAYFGELCEERKKDWYYKDYDPYKILQDPVKLYGKGHVLWDKGNQYFDERIQIDWSSYAWRSTKEQVIIFLEETMTTLPWLVEDSMKEIECIKQYLEAHGHTKYGILFIEEF